MYATPTKPAASGPGRPRNPKIDDAVLRATVELLETVGYTRMTIADVATRAGTTKPAIYRRWPTKAHLVHEAVFPAESFETIVGSSDLRSDLRVLVVAGVDRLGHPAARAALPGLLAETTADRGLGSDVLGLASGPTLEWLSSRLDNAVSSGQVRTSVTAEIVFDLIAGAAFVTTAIREGDGTDEAWIDAIVDIIMHGIAV
jgi:AcrR family transcriptional regulator